MALRSQQRKRKTFKTGATDWLINSIKVWRETGFPQNPRRPGAGPLVQRSPTALLDPRPGLTSHPRFISGTRHLRSGHGQPSSRCNIRPSTRRLPWQRSPVWCGVTVCE